MSTTCHCGAQISANVFVCEGCTQAARTDLSESADYLAHLDDKRARRGSNFPKGAGGRSSDTPLPYDPRVHAIATSARVALTGWVRLTITEHGCHDLPSPKDTRLVKRLQDELAAWRKVYRDAADLSPLQRQDIRTQVIMLMDDLAAAKVRADLSDLSRLCEWLADHLDWIATRPWALDILTDADRLRDNLVHLFDIPPETMALGRCDSEVDGHICDHILAAPITATHYACPRCGTTHDTEKRRRELLAKSDDQLVTAKDAARLLTLGGWDVSPRTMRAVIRLVGVRPRLEAKVPGVKQRVALYNLRSLREALHLCRTDDDTRKRLDAEIRGARDTVRATLSA